VPETETNPLGSARYLVDNSVYARAHHPLVAPIWSEGLRREQLVSCGPFAAEAVYSARNATEAVELVEELTEGMPYVEVGESAWRLARNAQLELAHISERFHRRPPIDFLIAAAAHEHGLGVLHYDRDYELIEQHTSLSFEARWVAGPGRLLI
jgi:predicted nucleic acid-binding protein